MYLHLCTYKFSISISMINIIATYKSSILQLRTFFYIYIITDKIYIILIKYID